MKSIIILSLVSSALLAGIIERSNGSYVEIFSEKKRHSKIVATVSTSKGRITKKICTTNRNKEEWCKVIYSNRDVNIRGFVDKRTLSIVNARPKTKETFEAHYGGDRDDVGNAIIPLKDGALIVGYTESFGAGNDDAYVMRVDRFGNKMFSSAFGGGGDDSLNAVVKVKGGFLLAGTTRSYGNRQESLYLARMSDNGQVQWQNGYYSDKDDYYRGNDMIKISDKNVLVVGSEDHVKFFDSNKDMYLNAIDMDGRRNGIKRYGGEDTESANSVVAVKGGYVIAGETETWGHGDKDAYIIKVDYDGNRVWHNAYGFRYDEVANQIINTSDGGFILVGTTESDIQNQKDVFVVKIDANGNRQWKRHYGTKEHEEGNGIVEVADGYVIAGYTKYTSSYNSDVYLLKITKAGNIVWNRRYGGEKDDAALAIAKVRDGFMITGYTTSAETYSKDMYLIRVDNDGRIK
ncbi:hypothetical protein [Sulfurimonas sp.]